MQLYTLIREQWVDRPLARVFPFFERPENLAPITPPSLDFRLLTRSPVEMRQGRTVDYTTIPVMPSRLNRLPPTLPTRSWTTPDNAEASI
jgi:ligand-binding SRPBCC domain-containing protein